MKHTIFLRRALALLLLLTLTLTMALPTLAASSATAADMRLVKTEGKVTVGNQSGKTLSVRDNMKLYSGYTISTDAESYAWLTLDAEKAVKLDASSALEVRKKGKKLELLLVDGKIYFDVSAPLDDGETMNIRTSTMVTGIRGTSGIIATSGSVSSATLLTGAAQVTSLTTGESMLVQAGTMGVVTPTSMAAQPVSSIDGFAAKEIQSNPDQAKAVEEATGQSVDNADAQLASDQAKAADSQQQLDALMQDVNGAAASTGQTGISDQAMAELLKTGEITRPGESTGGQEEDDIPGSDSGDTGSSTTPPATEIWIREAIDLATLEKYFQAYEAVTITTGGSVTVPTGTDFSIPSKKTLTITADQDTSGNKGTPGKLILTYDDHEKQATDFTIAEGAVFNVYASGFECGGNIRINGTMNIEDATITVGTTYNNPDYGDDTTLSCTLAVMDGGKLNNAGNLTITGDTNLYANSTVNNYGYMDVGYVPGMEGTLTNSGYLTTGMFTISAGGTVINCVDLENSTYTEATIYPKLEFYVGGGTMVNRSRFEISQGVVYIHSDGTFYNSGDGAKIIISYGYSLNIGYFDANNYGRTGHLVNENNATIENNGSMTIYADSTFNNTATLTGSAPTYAK